MNLLKMISAENGIEKSIKDVKYCANVGAEIHLQPSRRKIKIKSESVHKFVEQSTVGNRCVTRVAV